MPYRGPEDEEGRTMSGKADDDRRLERLLHVMGKTGLGHRKPDLGHRPLNGRGFSAVRSLELGAA